MPRAVKASLGEYIHFLPDTGHRTQCGLSPIGKAGPVIDRCLMCSICFGKDRGLKSWNALRLGVERIVE